MSFGQGFQATARSYRILYPEDQIVSEEQLIQWARDDIANGASSLVEDQTEVRTVEDAIAVLEDSGTVTLAERRA